MSVMNSVNQMTRPEPALHPLNIRHDAYEPVARAIDFLVANHDDAPSLDQVAAEIGLSPAHFQKVFKEGAGVSPKRFQQYLTAGAAKKALKEGATVLDASFEAGLSGPSRLHDLLLAAEAMTPGAYRKKGEGETIRHAAVSSPFGAALIGATRKGICWLSFVDVTGVDAAMDEMKGDWPAADFVEDPDVVEPLAFDAFEFAAGARPGAPVRLHVQGTNFQLKVWDALLRIPLGACVTYGDIAGAIGSPKASRAVGTAVGSNTISVLIPCHRVILSSGAIHNYRWGTARKKAILALEAALTETEAA